MHICDENIFFDPSILSVTVIEHNLLYLIIMQICCERDVKVPNCIGPNKKIRLCGSDYPTYPNFLPPTQNFFFAISVKLFI